MESNKTVRTGQYRKKIVMAMIFAISLIMVLKDKDLFLQNKS